MAKFICFGHCQFEQVTRVAITLFILKMSATLLEQNIGLHCTMLAWFLPAAAHHSVRKFVWHNRRHFMLLQSTFDASEQPPFCVVVCIASLRTCRSPCSICMRKATLRICALITISSVFLTKIKVYGMYNWLDSWLLEYFDMGHLFVAWLLAIPSFLACRHPFQTEKGSF